MSFESTQRKHESFSSTHLLDQLPSGVISFTWYDLMDLEGIFFFEGIFGCDIFVWDAKIKKINLFSIDLQTFWTEIELKLLTYYG